MIASRAPVQHTTPRRDATAACTRARTMARSAPCRISRASDDTPCGPSAAIARRLDPSYPAPAGGRVNVVYRINLKDAATYFLAREFQVRNKDVIYVAAAPATEFYKAMQLFSTLTQPAITAASFCVSGKC